MVVAMVVLTKPHRAAAKDGPVAMTFETVVFMTADFRGGDSGAAHVRELRPWPFGWVCVPAPAQSQRLTVLAMRRLRDSLRRSMATTPAPQSSNASRASA